MLFSMRLKVMLYNSTKMFENTTATATAFKSIVIFKFHLCYTKPKLSMVSDNSNRSIILI